MNKAVYLLPILVGLVACQSEDSETVVNSMPIVTSESAYGVLTELDIIYAEGLVHSETSMAPFSSRMPASGASGTPASCRMMADMAS